MTSKERTVAVGAGAGAGGVATGGIEPGGVGGLGMLSSTGRGLTGLARRWKIFLNITPEPMKEPAKRAMFKPKFTARTLAMPRRLGPPGDVAC